MALAEPPDPEIARMLERALAHAEDFRKQLQTAEYDAKIRVQEWDGRGRLRGTVKAHAIVRPGDPKPMTFISREVQGKVRLPDDKPGKEEGEKEVTLQEFAREHQIAERFAFEVTGTDEVAGRPARRVSFRPKPKQPVRNTADRFLNTISGTAWVSVGENKLVKFEMKLLRPFQLFWILAVLKDLSIQYELISPGDILGHARVKVLFAVTTPVYSIRQLHDVDMDNFRRREAIASQPWVRVPHSALRIRNHVLDISRSLCWNPVHQPPMRQIPKTELSPDNGCVIDTKWGVAPLKYHACAAAMGDAPTLTEAPPMPELIVYDHAGFRGAYARTNLSFLYLGDFWNDRISSLIIVSGVWQFFRDDYYKGDMWELGPGFYECFFMEKGPDDVVSSFKATALTWGRQS